MKRFLISLSSCIAVAFPALTLANNADFLCKDVPGMPRARAQAGKCQEHVECAYISETNRQRILEQVKKDHVLEGTPNYKSIATTDRLDALNRLGITPVFHPATLTCKGHSEGASAETLCPDPEECKGEAVAKESSSDARRGLNPPIQESPGDATAGTAKTE